jgi:ZIP family zinc transporter/zinc and cadmium transporter
MTDLAQPRLLIGLLAGAIAGAADGLGGYILVRRNWALRSLRYFVALSAGFMMATVLLEMAPESFHTSGSLAAPLLLVGYCMVHLLEHTITPHFHFGEETHPGEFLSRQTSVSVMIGLATHTFFDGIAIASGFVLSSWLGWIIFLGIVLHKMPEGFTVASVMLASGGSRRAALYSSLFLGGMTVLGVVALTLFPSLVRYGLPLSAGVAIYVAATDLVPEVNREPGIRMALVFFAGIALFAVIRLIAAS